MKQPTHDCIRTLAFTATCDADGNTDSATLLAALLRRVADIVAHDEIQDACGGDFTDLRPREDDDSSLDGFIQRFNTAINKVKP